MLLKGLSEVQSSPRPLASAEMVLVRMAYVADLPTPDEALKMLANKDFRPPMPTGAGSGPSTPPDATIPTSAQGQPTGAPPMGQPSGPTAMAPSHGNLAAVPSNPEQSVGAIEQAPAKPANLRLVASQSDDALANKQKDASQQQTSKPQPGNMQITRFEQIVGLASKNRDIALKIALEQNVRPVSVRQGFLEIAFQGPPDQALIVKLNRRLQDWTGIRWVIEVSREHGQDTLSQRKEQAVQKARDDADTHPTVEAVRKHFPGVKVVDVRINRDFEEDYLAPVVEDVAELTDQNLLEMSLRDDDSFGLDDDL
jgi:DNA polymerase-3 subunit gamma/tau